jgi:hypothetical protein
MWLRVAGYWGRIGKFPGMSVCIGSAMNERYPALVLPCNGDLLGHTYAVLVSVPARLGLLRRWQHMVVT